MRIAPFVRRIVADARANTTAARANMTNACANIPRMTKKYHSELAAALIPRTAFTVPGRSVMSRLAMFQVGASVNDARHEVSRRVERADHAPSHGLRE